MSPGRVKLQLVVFFLLSAGVATNLFFLQPRNRGLATASAAMDESRIALMQPVAFGGPGLITGSNRASQRDDAASKQAGAATAARPNAAAVTIPKDHSDVTRAVQRELHLRGYETGSSDGVPNLMTRAAIMGFEYDHGMALTGRPSQGLLKVILLGRGGSSKPVGSRGQSAEAETVIRSVQTSLAKLGYRAGHINGRLTPETARAIREFEVDQALPESGRVSGPLIARLAGLAGDGRIASGR